MPTVEVQRARVLTAAIIGVKAIAVTVEIEAGGGLPGFQIVGMGDAGVQEARHRVKSAVRAAGFRMDSNRRITVNLAPADVRKTGSGFDLPIAVAYLLASHQIDPSLVEGSIMVGELNLSGDVRPVRGLFAYALAAQEKGFRLLSGFPQDEFPELEGLEHLCIDSLRDLKCGRLASPRPYCPSEERKRLDYQDVAGQEGAIRAMTIAAAGGHGVLMVGPPGSGKSMIARRLPSILPPLSHEEKVESALIHSVAGLDVTSIAKGVRPFRSPHHSASTAALVGGGRPLQPGEASLAHNGVLFLDELAEFSSSSLQTLRQPMEEGEVSLCRAEGRVTFPARFQLIAASNPCPCGFLGDKEHVCKCTEPQINRYRGKLGGPMKDRIDLICEVARIDPGKVLSAGNGKSSETLHSQVMAARERSQHRGQDGWKPLASTPPQEVLEACGLTKCQQKLLESIARQYQLSGRGIVRTLRVARTIADLEDSAALLDEHLYEALMYRTENALE